METEAPHLGPIACAHTPEGREGIEGGSIGARFRVEVDEDVIAELVSGGIQDGFSEASNHGEFRVVKARTLNHVARRVQPTVATVPDWGASVLCV